MTVHPRQLMLLLGFLAFVGLSCKTSKSPSAKGGSPQPAEDDDTLGEGPGPADEFEDAEPPPDDEDTIDLTPTCEEEEDFHRLEFPDDVRDCLIEGKTYNFDEKKCTTMATALFDCSYDSVRLELKALGISDAQLTQHEQAGLKLIGCGASNNGYTIVTQHWQPAADRKDDCIYTEQGKVVQACFRKVIGEPPPNVSDPKAYVTSCMTE